MTELRQGNGRHNEAAFRNKPPRVPRLVAYQTKGQLPMTVLALIVIAACMVVVWLLR